MHAPRQFTAETVRLQRFTCNDGAYFYDPSVGEYAVFWKGVRYACRTGAQAQALLGQKRRADRQLDRQDPSAPPAGHGA